MKNRGLNFFYHTVIKLLPICLCLLKIFHSNRTSMITQDFWKQLSYTAYNCGYTKSDINELFHIKTSNFSTRALILLHPDFVSQFYQ